jgi:catechol 2,3-dioxygenase-like lactoylglutathione lyase family enzyme
MLKTEGVLHFTIPVKDLNRAESFYAGILGFERIARIERIVFMRAGAIISISRCRKIRSRSTRPGGTKSIPLSG